MKISALRYALIAFSLVSVLSSCSFLQKGEFSERKYYNFPRSKHTVTQTASTPQKAKPAPVTEAAKPEVKQTAEPVITASSVKKKVVAAAPAPKTTQQATAPATTPTEEADASSVRFKKSEIKKEAKKIKNTLPFNNGSTMLFLAVIASIFIPPLGVYIKDHRTNKWFWITLLLWVAALSGFAFAGVEFIYTGLSGLLWLIAVIIALMVVFEFI